MADEKKLTEDEKTTEAEKLKREYVVKEYKLIYDAFGKTLEPVYFWILDFLRHQIGYNVEKTEESMSATVVSQFFGEMGTRRTALERRASELLGTINTVVKSIINLLYDLKEFDERLAMYDDLHKGDDSAEKDLKRVWMDEVDVKKGTGSLLALSANEKYQFVTLRDAFFSAKNIKNIDEMDLNVRVKNILKSRYKEYEKWLERSERELRQRRKIELTYLKSQVESLKLYTKWARPYLRSIKMLGFKDLDPSNADIVSAFNQAQVEVGIRAFKKVFLYEKLRERKYSESMKSEKGPMMYAIIEVKFNFRSSPVTVEKGAQSSGYGMMGKVTVDFAAYAMTQEQLDELKRAEEDEDLKLINDLTQGSLMALKDDLNKYLKEIESGVFEKKEEKKPRTFVGEIVGSFREQYGGKGKKGKKKGKRSETFPRFSLMSRMQKNMMVEEARQTARSSMYTLYNIYKKGHAMLNLITFPRHEMRTTEGLI